MEPYWNLVKEIIRESDIVLEILDARDVVSSRNHQLGAIIKEFNRPNIIVVNKADLVSKKELSESITLLKTEAKDKPDSGIDGIVFFSSKIKKTTKNLLLVIKKIFAKYGKRKDFYSQPIIKRPFREAKGDIIVGVVGYPNVGKSSIINALCFKTKVKVSSKAGTTHGIHWVSAGGKNSNQEGIRLIDTPGVVPIEKIDEVQLGLISARSAEKIKSPDTLAGKMIELFIKDDKLGKVEDFYGVKLEERQNSSLILDELAKKKGHLRKGGIPDDMRMSLVIIKDWQNGKLRL